MNMKVTAMAVGVLFFLTGCTTQVKPTFNAKYYPQCYDPVAKLCKDQDHSSEVKGTVAGALLGALAGALIGATSSKDSKGVWIGAAAGAAVGGLTGFFTQHLSKIKDREERLAQFQRILGDSSRGWELEKASVERAFMCYREQIVLLKTQARNKQISKEDFLSRMQEIRDGIDNINTYWAQAKDRMDSRLADGSSFLINQAREDEQRLKAQERERARMQYAATQKKLETAKSKKVNDVRQVDSLSADVKAEFLALENAEFVKDYNNELKRGVG